MKPKTLLDFEPSLVGLERAAAVFEVSPTEFWRGVQAGDYPPPVGFKGGRRWRLKDLREFAEGLLTVDPSERQRGGRKAS